MGVETGSLNDLARIDGGDTAGFVDIMRRMDTTQHIPVLLQPVLDALLPEGKSVERVIDGTLGAGGHTAALLDAGVNEVLGLDRDPDALALARGNLARFGERAHTAHASYVTMQEEAAKLGWEAVDGILLDLGVSSMQLDRPERGFAFRFDGPLDMRFDHSNGGMTAAALVNHVDADELATILRDYGEEPQHRKLARAIVDGRPYTTTTDLADAIEAAVPRKETYFRRGKRIEGDKIHPATRVFQAIRIAVNDELGTLERTLPLAIDLLKPGGRLAVMSFHSLEDRIVKHAFKRASVDCICPPKAPICVCDHEATVRLVNRKPITATEDELNDNPRSRSAKLRVVEKLS